MSHPEGKKTIAEEEKAAEANMRRDKEGADKRSHKMLPSGSDQLLLLRK